jgi:hypothetical protein
MTTKPDRHTRIEVTCQLESCGKKFFARRERVEKGQSRFCSMVHYREYQKSIGSQRSNIGKENAIIQWDNSEGLYRAYWFESETMRYTSTSWARWAWELNFGEVPNGYRVSYKDGDPANMRLENLFLKSWQEYGDDLGKRTKGVPKSEESKKRMSASHSGKTLSEEHRKHIGDANRRKWGLGVFDKVHKGAYSKHWRGGVPNGYPREFGEIRDFIRERDRYMCQICGKHLHKTRDSHVHHIDGNRKHNDPDNLKLLCTACHGLVHSNKPAPPPILAFRSMLEWNQVEEQ